MNSLFFSRIPAMDTGTLAKIIQYIQNSYQPPEKTDYGGGFQFAAMINVEQKYCSGPFDNNFLDGENSATVKEQLNKVSLYQGQKLVVAVPMNKGQGGKAVHSERVLLMCGDNNQAVTPVKNLLNKIKDGCSVFYTYNSPCMQFCLNQQRDEDERKREQALKERNEKNRLKGKKIVPIEPAVKKCIVDSLDILTNYRGLKAFVFSRVYDNDIGNTEDEKKRKVALLAAALKTVAEKVPLYKCSGTSCVNCLSGGEIVSQCLSNNP
ncbi:hypothetical protein ACEWY4_023329 [Coilia grayii]|uniref:Uncharacterized protein n=1 Tax=Coilia grayii TaxID=363190 RepID=A0ABD1J2P9_9TELE